jgi:hypothetical protein
MFPSEPSSRLIGLACLAVAACSRGAAPGSTGTAQLPGCTSTDAPPTVVDSTGPTQDVRAGRTFRCILHAGGPVLEVKLVADSAENKIVRLEIGRSNATTPFQTLTQGEDESPYRGAEFFAARDLDANGYLDLMLLSDWGVTGNSYYNVWRWNPASERFVFDSTLSTIASPTPVTGQPCVRTRANSGDAGMSYDSATLCLQHDRWIRTVIRTQRRDGRLNAFLRETRELRGDSLVLTRVDTVRDSIR